MGKDLVWTSGSLIFEIRFPPLMVRFTSRWHRSNWDRRLETTGLGFGECDSRIFRPSFERGIELGSFLTSLGLTFSVVEIPDSSTSSDFGSGKPDPGFGEERCSGRIGKFGRRSWSVDGVLASASGIGFKIFIPSLYLFLFLLHDSLTLDQSWVASVLIESQWTNYRNQAPWDVMSSEMKGTWLKRCYFF